VFTGSIGAPYLSTFYFDDNDPVGVTAQQCVAATGTFWAAVDNVVSSTYAWATEPEVQTVDAATGLITAITATTPATGQGSGGTTGPPTAIQGLLRWNTQAFFGGRRLKGRTFIPGIQSTAISGNTVLSSYRTIVDAAAAALIADANTEFVIWSKRYGSAQNVSSGTTWTTVAVLRSRRD
jgi:hypothetical protein